MKTLKLNCISKAAKPAKSNIICRVAHKIRCTIQSAAKLFEHLRYVVSQKYLMQFYEINICEVIIFRLYTIYTKHEMIKTDIQNSEKSQVLSQVLE